MNEIFIINPALYIVYFTIFMIKNVNMGYIFAEVDNMKKQNNTKLDSILREMGIVKVSHRRAISDEKICSNLKKLANQVGLLKLKQKHG